MKYFTEIFKLAEGLKAKGIAFEMGTLYDGYQIVVPGKWDAVCHSGSWGHRNDLLEVMGVVARSEDDDVEGYLTAEEILTRVDESL